MSKLGQINNNTEVDKTLVGLDQVDNTSDIDKPISSATQTALDNIDVESASIKYAIALG